MGQRHQAFVIARLVPHGQNKAYYRCIAALHHEWCYGRLPLRAARRFLTLVKHKDNSEIIREEIRLLQGKYGRWENQPNMPDVPSPYISFLLASAWNLDFDDPSRIYASGNSAPLPADMGSSEGENNDGITVIDVTDPDKPAYCFVSATGLESETGVDICALTATDYARVYYPIPEPEEMSKEQVRRREEDVLKVISSLEDESLVVMEMLAEAWPREYEGYLAGKDEKETTKDAKDKNTSIPALSELCLKPALDLALQLGKTGELEELVWMPGKAADIIAELRTRKLVPDSALSLLAKALGQGVVDNVLDLSHFLLSTDQIGILLAYFDSIEVLKLSYNPFVTGETIRTALKAVPNLRRLVLLGTSIPHRDVFNLFLTSKDLFFRLEALVLPELCRWKGDPYPNAFSFLASGLDSFSDSCAAIASLPLFTPALVVQALTDYLSGFVSNDPFGASSIVSASFAPQVMFSTEVRKVGQRWGERSVPFVARRSLRAYQNEGWIFAFTWPVYFDTKGKYYGFIQVKSVVAEHREQGDQEDQGASGQTVYSHRLCDLKGFLAEMENEGRPSPPVAAVTALEGVLDKLKKNGLALMTWKEAEWVTKVSSLV